MTNPKLIYLRVWRTAFERGKLEIPYPTKAACDKMRLNLYRAVAPYRKDQTLDPGFTRIVEKMEMVMYGDSAGWTLTIRDKSLNPLVIAATKALDELENE
jgi:hypothetical protein